MAGLRGQRGADCHCQQLSKHEQELPNAQLWPYSITPPSVERGQERSVDPLRIRLPGPVHTLATTHLVVALALQYPASKPHSAQAFRMKCPKRLKRCSGHRQARW